MKRSVIITLALIATVAAPLCASSGWARGLGVLGLGGGGGVVTPGAVVSDDFSSNSAADYTAINGGISISSGTAGGQTSWAKNMVYHEGSLGSANQSVEADVTYNGYSDSAGVLFRVDFSSTPVTGYSILLESGYIKVYRFSGTTTTFIVQTASGGRTAGTYNIRVTISGNAITVYENDTQILVTTDSTYSTGSYCGLIFKRDGSNFDARADNLEGNPL